MNKLSLVTILLCCMLAGSGQKVWYFGKNAGIRFTTNSLGLPSAFGSNTTNPIITEEGAAIVHDNQGNVLISTDGVKVYGKNNLQMPNGYGLKGNASSTQSAIIIPVPGCCTKYFLFTTDYVDGTNGLSYSVVDMLLNNGNGDVIASKKNIPLITYTSGSPFTGITSEKLTATIDSAGGYWVLTKGHSGTLNANTFYAFHLTNLNCGTCPMPSISTQANDVIISNNNSWTTGDLGQLKFSPDGQHIATVGYGDNTIKVWDFDKTTGVISNQRSLLLTRDDYLYGLEFSPDNNTIYFTSILSDLSLYSVNYNGNSIFNLQNIYNTVSSNIDQTNGGFYKYRFGSLQLANDSKIYAANGGSVAPSFFKKIGVIKNPNNTSMPNYMHDVINLPSNTASSLSLPTQLLHTYCTPCDTSSLSLSVNSSDDLGGTNSGVISVSVSGGVPPYTHNWSNGLTGSGTVNHLGGGPYYDTVTDQTGCIKIAEAHLCAPGNIQISNNIKSIYCTQKVAYLEVLVSGIDGPFTHSWTTPSQPNGYTFNAVPFGTYYDTITDARGCRKIDTIQLKCNCASVVKLGNDTTICAGGSITIGPNPTPQYAYQWGSNPAPDSNLNQSATLQITPVATTEYYLTVSDGVCNAKDTIRVAVGPCPVSCCNPWPASLTYKYWNNYPGTNNTTPDLTGSIANNGTITLGSGASIDLPGIQAPCNSGSNCAGALNFSLYAPDGSLFVQSGTYLNNGAFTEMSCSNTGSYKLVIKATCGSNSCDSFVINLIKRCPPCCPNINHTVVNLSGHCVLRDTITNPCNQSISSWRLDINNLPYSGTALTPQTIQPGGQIGLDILMNQSLVNQVASYIYTFYYSNGDSCKQSGAINFANCVTPPCNTAQCTATATIKRSGTFLPWNGILQLNCDSLYLISPVFSCNPINTGYTAGTPLITDNFNASYTWPVGANAPNLKIPATWPANRTYTVTYRWISNADPTCIINKSFQFVLNCLPCGAVCNPIVTLTASGQATQQLTINNNYSAGLACSVAYTFSSVLNCNNNAVVVTNVKLLSNVNTVVTTVPAWLANFINNNGTGTITAPSGFSGMYKVRYYYGTNGSNNPCDSFTTILNFSCVDCCAGGHWQQKPIMSYPFSNAALYSLDCANQQLILLKAPKVHCDSSLLIKGSYACGTASGCTSRIEYSLLTPGTLNTVVTGNNSLLIPSTLAAGTYLLKYKVYCGAQVCDSCLFELEKDACVTPPVNCCTNASWASGPVVREDGVKVMQLDCKNPSVIEISSTKGNCDKTILINNGQFNCATGSNCTSSISYKLLKADGVTVMVPLSIGSITFPNILPDGNYVLRVYGNCGGTVCDSCSFPVKVACKTCDCQTSGCSLAPKFSVSNSGISKDVVCGTNFSLDCSKLYVFNLPVKCPSGTCANAIVKVVLKDASGHVIAGPAIAPLNYTFVSNGLYSVEFFEEINGITCAKCTSAIKVKCSVPPSLICNSCSVALNDAGMDDANTMHASMQYTEISEYFAFSNLPTNLTQVKATVTDIQLWAVDNTGTINQECLGCSNPPISWGSIIGANPVGTSGNVISPQLLFAGNQQSFPVNLSVNQNPRTVQWGDGSSLFNVTGGSFSINFAVPMPSTLSCCKRKVKLCVRFVFRNDKCEECTVLKCVERDL